jgi:hypothetical protein
MNPEKRGDDPRTPELCLSPTLRAKARYRCAEAVEYLRERHGIEVAQTTLDKLRSMGGGPVFQKFNRTPLYHRNDLDQWAIAKLGPRLISTSAIAQPDPPG